MFQHILESKVTDKVMMLLYEAATLGDIHARYYADISDRDFRTIVQADPTWNKGKPDKMGRYGKWLLGLYKKGSLKLEDLYKVTEDLKYFVKYYNKIEDKDINHYADINQLYDVVKPFKQAQEDGQELATSKSDEVRKAKADCRKIFENGEWLILVPLTKEAAIYYGKNTRWCTAATNGNNMFAHYNAKGPLYVNIDKRSNRKYQFHFETSQFMDEEDRPIATPILQNIGMSVEVASKAYGNDVFMLENEDGPSMTKVMDGWYCNNKALFRYDPSTHQTAVAYDGGGWYLEATWLGNALIFVSGQMGTAVINAKTGKIVDKGSIDCVKLYKSSVHGNIFACNVKDGLRVCQVTDKNIIKILVNFRTTARPYDIDGTDEASALERYFQYSSGDTDRISGESTVNIYDLETCRGVLEDVVPAKGSHLEETDYGTGIIYRTAVVHNDYDYYDDDEYDDDYSPDEAGPTYYIFLENGEMKQIEYKED